MTGRNGVTVSNEAKVNDLPAARRAAVEWAKHICTAPFIVVDLETTDKEPKWAEPVQIAIVGSDGKTLFKSYIKPKKAMATEAAEKTGITPDMLKDAPTFQQVYPRIAEILAEKTVVAYNASFDQPILRNTALRLGLADPTGPSKWADAMVKYSDFHGEWHVHPHYGGSYRWKGLGHATVTFDLVNEAAHDAEADALATVKVMKALAAVDFTKPQVYQFEQGKFTILYPDGKEYTIERGGEGAFAAIRDEVKKGWESRAEVLPTDAVAVIKLSPEEANAKRQKLNALLEAYAPARVAHDAEGKRLDEQEAAIKKLYMELDAGGVQGAHDALYAKETRKWTYSEVLLVELAQQHDKALLKYTLDESQFEEKLKKGLFAWAGAFAPALKVNRFAAWNPNALKLVAAARQNVAPVVITPVTIPKAAAEENAEDESWREEIPF